MELIIYGTNDANYGFVEKIQQIQKQLQKISLSINLFTCKALVLFLYNISLPFLFPFLYINTMLPI